MGNDAALIPAVQAFVQGDDIETAPERLERVWHALAPHRDGTAKGIHGAELNLLRWLLKMAHGSGDAAERFRRYPRTWDIMRIVFDWIPLFPLAQALADRRFIPILQQTLQEISKPNKASPNTNGDVEMADADGQYDPDFDLSLQRQMTMCLKSAQAVLSALRILINRCESIPRTEKTRQRMGAEHVKSLFYTSAADAMKLLRPIIILCGLVAENYEERGDSPSDLASWMTTFTSIWDLHLRGSDDATVVASNLSGFAANLLGKLTGIPERRPLAIESTVQSDWAHELRLFLFRNVILPSRLDFADKERAAIGRQIMGMAIDMSSFNFKTCFPVLFDLIAKTPRTTRHMTSKRDYENWVQASFDAFISAMKSHGVQGLPAQETILEMAAEQNVPLSLPTLRAVCKDYALQEDGFAWKILFFTLKLNPDVFLISAEGQELLDRILEKTGNSQSMNDEDLDNALRFVVLLAESYAKARDLSTFLKTWLRYLAVGETKVKLERLWARPEVFSAVASVVQDSLNAKQLVEIIDWLASRTSPAEVLGRIHILAAISSGISNEELVDATNMKTFETAFLEKFSKKEPTAISVSRWLVAQNAISEGTPEDIKQIWSTVKSDIGRILKKSTIAKEGTFAAFKCAVAAWIANYPGGPHEEEVADMVCAFVERLDKDTESEESTPENPITKGTYASWILSGNSRILTLIGKRKKQFPEIVLDLLVPKDTASSNSVTFAAAETVISQLLENENLINDDVCQDLISKMIEQLDPSQTSKTMLGRRVAVRFLLGIPDEIFIRPDRETVMEHILSRLPEYNDASAEDELEYLKLVLYLIMKAMTQPTFYRNMSYSQLENIGKRLYKLYGQAKELKSSKGILLVRDVFRVLEEIAALTVRQIASGNPEEREKTYLDGAAELLKGPCKKSDAVTKLTLLHAFISALQGSPNLDKLQEVGRNVEELKNKLLEDVKAIVELGKWRGETLLSLIIALKATCVLDRQVIRETFTPAMPALVRASEKYLQKNSQFGWEIRMFLARYFVEEMGSPLKLRFLTQEAGGGEDDEEGAPPALVHKATLLQYVDILVRDTDDETKMDYLKEVLVEQSGDRLEESYRLLIIRTLVHHLAVARGAAPISHSGFELAQAHNILCKKLPETAGQDAEQFALIAETLYILLDQKAVCMLQWNIDNTFATVTAVCAKLDQALSGKHVALDESVLGLLPKTYKYLCALVEIIIKRHRKRIDGHFHLLIPVLQALLHLLCILSPKPDKKPLKPSPLEAAEIERQQRLQEKNAWLYTRLLTLICEPTVASVSTGRTAYQHNGADHENDEQPNVMLDVEKDKAKKYAGQFMYLVVGHYICLQQRGQTVVLTGEAREAVETGMFSILDITTKGGKGILAAGMDNGGRAILKELLRRYERIGRQSGV